MNQTLLAFIRNNDPEARMLNDRTIEITRPIELPSRATIDGHGLFIVHTNPAPTQSRRSIRRKRERELAKHPRSPSLLALNARDITPSGKGWIRMRHGDHFSQWCKGMLCVKLRTVVERDAIVHRVEVICGHATVERRQGAVLKAFGLSGAECTHQETGSAKFRFEVA